MLLLANYTTVSNTDLYLSYFDLSYVFPGHNDSVQRGLTVFFIFLGELEPLETSVDLCNVLTSGAKFCKHCDTAVQANMVKYKKSELEPLLTKLEKDESHDELYFCDENCYFQFAIGRADKVSFQKKN